MTSGSMTAWSEGPSAASASNPVSYTHLDVYKRQVKNCISGALGAVRDAGGDSGVELERSVDVDSYGAVSYTHLPCEAWR